MITEAIRDSAFNTEEKNKKYFIDLGRQSKYHPLEDTVNQGGPTSGVGSGF